MFQLHRVISGGQTGVDRAAWDAAMACGFSVGGWCPRGRRAEDGMISSRYPCTETPLDVYEQRTEWNVRDSTGTLVLTCGPPTGGTAYTLTMVRRWKKPLLMLDLCAEGVSPEQVLTWLRKYRIEVLNVAGPRESTVPGMYEKARSFLEQVFCALRSSVGTASSREKKEHK